MNIRVTQRHSLSIAVMLMLAMVLALAIACSGDDSREMSSSMGYAGAPGESAGDYDDMAMDSGTGYGITEEQYESAKASAASEPASAQRPAATAKPAAPAFAMGDESGSDGSAGTSSGHGGSASVEAEIAAATDGRIIVRTADMSATVANVTESLDDIAKMAASAGGWVVSQVQSRQYAGRISIRVPADRYDDVLDQISDLATKVESLTSRSEDFTEEFTDVTARAQTLEDTLERLRLLYDRAFSVEDAITIQKEITDIQSDLESLEARLTFLSQSSAFSFISVDLESVPIELAIDAGDDIAAAVGHPVTYRATFTPPADMEDFWITWNFGDGSREQTTDRIAPTGNGDEVITSPIIHYFDRDEDSPFIVTVELRGSGDAGIAEGEDTLVTTVSRLPVIEVFAGENQTVEYDNDVEFSASFTRPEGISDIAYSWNFGDGSAPVESDVDAAQADGQVETTHVYKNFRPNPYIVTLTVTGQTEVGEVEAKGEFLVFVRETIGVAAADLDAGSTSRDAVRTLQSIGVFFATAALWLAILSPAWIIGAVVIFFLLKRRGSIKIPRRNRSVESSEN